MTMTKPIPPMTESDVVAFWARSHPVASGCREWTGNIDSKGYGRLKINGVMYMAHRIALTLASGPIPDGLAACHRCDNPPCVNPDHLFAATVGDNTRDCAAKGRHARTLYPDRYGGKPGEANGFAKLTDAAISDIRARYAAGGISQQRLADEYGVHQGTISKVVLGKAWTHVA